MLPKNGAMRGPPVLGNETENKFTTHILIFINMIITFNFLALTLTF